MGVIMNINFLDDMHFDKSYVFKMIIANLKIRHKTYKFDSFTLKANKINAYLIVQFIIILFWGRAENSLNPKILLSKIYFRKIICY